MMRSTRLLTLAGGMVVLTLPACQHGHSQEHVTEHPHHTLVVTSPILKDVVVTQQYVCQIRARQHIEIRALEEGYLEEIPFQEGQFVKQGDVLFRILPLLYKARLDAELAEVRLAQIEYENTKRLYEHKPPVVSAQEVALYEAKLAKAKAKAAQAEAELSFTVIRAPFDGIVDRQYRQKGNLVSKEDLLTTLSDTSVMWVYFNVPEARYLEYMNGQAKYYGSQQVELVLANGSKFPEKGTIAAIGGQFNNETGNVVFRADFPNPHRLLRHGQTGNVLLHQRLHDALVIPQRATFEILEKRYVFVVDENHIVHQREIIIDHELDDIFVIKKGLNVQDKIVLEGVRQVQDGQRIEYEYRPPQEVLQHLKFHAE
jgi:membrane fusion protein (multidrug efflux system)